MSDIIDVNFKDEPEIHQAKAPASVKDTNGETWHCCQDWDGDCGQPYPELNEAGFISLADQHVMERDENEPYEECINGTVVSSKQAPHDVRTMTPDEKTPVEQELDEAYKADCQAISEKDRLLEKTNELSQIILNRPEGDGKYFAATVEEVAALKKLYELLKFEL